MGFGSRQTRFYKDLGDKIKSLTGEADQIIVFLDYEYEYSCWGLFYVIYHITLGGERESPVKEPEESVKY